MTGFRFQDMTVLSDLYKLHSVWTIRFILSSMSLNMVHLTMVFCIAAVSSSFWDAAKGGLRGELLLSWLNCLFFLLLPPWTGPFAPVGPLVAPKSSTFIALNASRYKTAAMHREFLVLAPNVSANQFLITAESIVAAYFCITKKHWWKM